MQAYVAFYRIFPTNYDTAKLIIWPYRKSTLFVNNAAYHYEESHSLSFAHRLESYFTTKLSIKLSIYKSGANREEMDDVLYT